jgi:tRNA G18 (ribose-2'-O)-methylase SpoU
MPNQDIILVLHNIRSRFNVGAIFRTADAAGVKKIYLCGITPAPPQPKIDKVALGAEKTVPFAKCKQTGPAIKQLKNLGYHIVALEQSKKKPAVF